MIQTPALNRHQRRRRETHGRLLQATASLLVSAGLEGLTVQRIAAQAKVARATFYVHFPDRDAAVRLVLHERFSDSLLAIVNRTGATPAETLSLWAQGLVHLVDQHRALASALLLADDASALALSLRDVVASTYEDSVRGGVLRPVRSMPLPLEAHLQASLVLEMLGWWLAEASSEDPERVAGWLVDALLR